MTGAWMFAADLARSIRSPVYCHFVQASSYGAGTLSSPSVRVSGAAPPGLRGEHLLLVDDIVDTGRTVAALIARLQAHRPRSLHVASLLSKPARRAVEVPIDFLGFEVPDEFVVGYGLDFAGHHRGLPDVHVLVPKQA